eukprot:PhF_6_TR8680/c0_g1_i1/m.13590
MFRHTQVFHASKATSSYCKNRYYKVYKVLSQFQYDLNTPVRGKTLLTHQRNRFDHLYFVRDPLYKAGNGVHMDPKTYSLTSKHDGIMTLKKSVVRPNYYHWVEVDPDIQKHRQANYMRSYHKQSGAYNALNTDNTHVQQEIHILKHGGPKRWYQEVQRVMPLTEMYQDPNLLNKCPEVMVNRPLIKPKYVWE